MSLSFEPRVMTADGANRRYYHYSIVSVIGAVVIGLCYSIARGEIRESASTKLSGEVHSGCGGLFNERRKCLSDQLIEMRVLPKDGLTAKYTNGKFTRNVALLDEGDIIRISRVNQEFPEPSCSSNAFILGLSNDYISISAENTEVVVRCGENAVYTVALKK